MFVWWLMAWPQLQLSLGGRGVSLCDFVLRAYVYIYLVGGASSYKHVLYRHVYVHGSRVQSLKVHNAAFTGMGVSFVCIDVCVYHVCTHMSTLCNDVLLW